MKIYRTFDDQAVKRIITHPDIWKTAAEENKTPDEFKANCKADCWLLLEVNERIIGTYNLHPHNCVTLEIHAHVLPEFRRRYSMESGNFALRWIVEEGPEQYQKVIAQVPVVYQNVIDFTLAHGFKKEGVNRLSALENGVIVDRWLLGITRDEIIIYLDQCEAA